MGSIVNVCERFVLFMKLNRMFLNVFVVTFVLEVWK